MTTPVVLNEINVLQNRLLAIATEVNNNNSQILKLQNANILLNQEATDSNSLLVVLQGL